MKINFFSEKNYYYREQIFTHIMLISLFFFIVVADLNSSFQNASYIYLLQLSFCAMYLLSFKYYKFIGVLVRKNKLGSALFIAWLVSVLLSLLNSFSLGFLDYRLSLARLLQTYMHAVFFLTCWHMFLTRAINLKIIFYGIALTSLIIMTAYLVHGYLYPFLSSSEWMNDPPFNSHIRHAGYQVVASICLLLALVTEKAVSQFEQWFRFLLLVLLFALLFWLGGRGAIISIFITILFYASVLFYKGKGVVLFLKIVFFALICAVLLSEYFVLFSWNGLSGVIFRSSDTGSINTLSSGRLEIWKATWEVYKNHILLGLGPQGFLSVPMSFRIVQPHNALIQFLIEWGLVGTLIFLALLSKGFYFGVKKNIIQTQEPLNIYALGAGGVIVALSVHALFDGTYYHPQPSLYLAFAFALWVQPIKPA